MAQKVFEINKLLTQEYPIVNNPIVIPEYILTCMKSLCNKNIEYMGNLLCYKGIVQYPYISSSGSIGHVMPAKKVAFGNKSYESIDWHTHPNSLGDYWHDKFSDGDIREFNFQLLNNSVQYQHVLFSPTHIITWANEVAPEVRIGFGNQNIVLDTFWEINKKHGSWIKPVQA